MYALHCKMKYFWPLDRAAAEDILSLSKPSLVSCLASRKEVAGPHSLPQSLYCRRFRRTDDEDVHNDDGGDTREARAARRAEMREQRQLELLAQASMRGPRRGKQQRGSSQEEAEAEYTSTSDEQGHSDIEASSCCPVPALLCVAGCRCAFLSSVGAT